MKLTRDQVKHVAKLANLPLSVEELDKFQEQLSEIIEYFEKLKSVDTEGIEPTYNVSPLKNVKREDEVEKSLSQEEALKNSHSTREGFFVTKGVFSDD